MKRDWPSVVPDDVKEEILDDFLGHTSSQALKESVCAVSGEKKAVDDMLPDEVNVSEINLDLFRYQYPDVQLDPFFICHCYAGVYLNRRLGLATVLYYSMSIKLTAGYGYVRKVECCIRRCSEGCTVRITVIRTYRVLSRCRQVKKMRKT